MNIQTVENTNIRLKINHGLNIITIGRGKQYHHTYTLQTGRSSIQHQHIQQF